MAHPAYGTAPQTPRNAGVGGFIPPPPGASQGGEPNPYPHPSPYNWPNNGFPPQQPQYSSYPLASALGGGPTRSARSNSQPHRPAVHIPQQIQSQPSYPYQFPPQPQPQAYLAQTPTSGQPWNLGQYHPSSLPTPSSFPIAPNDISRYSPYPASFQQHYSGQFTHEQLPSEDEPQIPFIPPDPDDKTRLPFGGTANAPRPLKPALKRSSSQSTTNQPSGAHTPNINRRPSSSGGAEMVGQNQENQVRLKKMVRSDSRAPEIIGDQNHGAQARSSATTTVRPGSGPRGAEMKKENQHGGNQARSNVVTRTRSGSSGRENTGANSEDRGRLKKKTTEADKSVSSQVTPAAPIAVAATSSLASHISPTSPTSPKSHPSPTSSKSPTSPTTSRSPTSPSSVPAYAQQDDEPYDANNLSGRPKDWRPDYCPTLGTSLYLKITRVLSEAYEDSVKRSVHSLLEYTPQSPPLALDLRYKVKGRNGAIISQRVLRASNNGDNVDFDQPALQPHASRIRLYHPKLPWYVDIHQSNPSGVTVQDVLVQLSSQMRTPIRNRHYYNDSLNDSARAALGQRYSARTEGRKAEEGRGVVQVDFLGEKFVMEGLVRGNKGLWEIKTRKR